MIAAIKIECEAGQIVQGNFSCNLHRNKIPTQVPGKIAQYNRGLTLAAFPRTAKMTGRDTSLSLKTIFSAFANPKLFESIVFRQATKKELQNKIRLLAAKGSLTE